MSVFMLTQISDFFFFLSQKFASTVPLYMYMHKKHYAFSLTSVNIFQFLSCCIVMGMCSYCEFLSDSLQAFDAQ